MNPFRSTLKTSGLIAIALCSSFAACTLQAQPSASCETVMGDQRVTAAIESRLRSSSRIQADDIVVVVVSGMAELRGLVRSDTHKLLAEQIARDTKGVSHLNNQLDVVDWAPVTDSARDQASQRDGTHRSRQVRSDTWITTTIQNTLALSHGADNCQIVVHTRDGVVVLQGMMTSAEARRIAVDLAAGTSGVRSVEAGALLVAGSTNAH